MTMIPFHSRGAAIATTVALLAMGVAAAGCFPSPGTSTLDTSSAPESTDTPTATPRPLVIAVATPEEWPTPSATSGRATPARPTAATPSVTPTATRPAATPTLAPISQLPELARALDEKAAALAQAISSHDSDAALRLQRDLITEAEKVEKTLQIDRSAAADLVRQAIGELRAGAAGDAGKLDSARDKLRLAAGSSSPNASATGGTPGAARSPQAIATSLQSKLRSLESARQQNSVGDLLRLQQELQTEIAEGEKAIANQHTEAADKLRSALQELKDGVAGDENKLASAADALQAVASTSAATGTRTTATSQQVQSAAANLDGKIAALRQALSGGSNDDLLRSQRDLLDEIDRTDAALKGNDSQEADRLRSALATAREGASGDPAKLDGARSQLADLAGSQSQTQPGRSTESEQPARVADIPAIASELSRSVDAYQEALAAGDRATLLRLQQELTEQVNRTEQAVRGGSGSQAEQMRSALADLRNGLGGDGSKLNSANATLRLVAGSSEPSQQPPASQSESGRQSARAVQQAARDLSKTMDNVASALRSADPEAVDRAKKELDQAEQSLRQLPPSETAPLRAAIGQAREALGGDEAKLDSARKQLEQVIPR